MDFYDNPSQEDAGVVDAGVRRLEQERDARVLGGRDGRPEHVDAGLELVSVTCDEDGEPQEACFETTICELSYAVKAGRETSSDTTTPVDTIGEFCVEPDTRHAISNIVFTCPEDA